MTEKQEIPLRIGTRPSASSPGRTTVSHLQQQELRPQSRRSSPGTPVPKRDSARGGILTLKSEIERLQIELEKKKRLCNEIETEKVAFSYQLSEVQKRSSQQLSRLQEQLAEVKKGSREQEEKIQNVELIEEEIVKFYMEFKDRSAEVVMENYAERRAELIEREKKELRRKNKPIAIIERLKATLRSLLAFKEDYENELKDQMNRRKTETEKELSELRQRMDKLVKENQEYKNNAIQAIHLKDQALTSKKEIIMESNNIVMKMKNDNLKMKDTLTEKEKEIDNLNEILDKRDKILRHRETQLMRVQQLQKEKQSLNSIHQMNLSKFRSDQNKLKRDNEKLHILNNRMKDERERNEESMRKLETDLRSYKSDANRADAFRLRKENEQKDRYIMSLENKIENMRREYSDMDTERRMLNVQLQELKTRNEKMKDEYAAIFEQHMRHQQNQASKAKEHHYKRRNSTSNIPNFQDVKSKPEKETAATVNRNILDRYRMDSDADPQLVSQYKQKLQEREREVAELTKRVRRMILAEHREHIQEKNFEIERSRMINELTTLRRNNPEETSTPFLKSKQLNEEDLMEKNRRLEEGMRDYDNLQNMYKTTAAAYGKLLELLPEGARNGSAVIGVDDSFSIAANSRADMSRSSSRGTGASVPSPSLFAVGRSASAAATIRRPQSAASSVYTSSKSRRPLSAKRTRPQSATMVRHGASRMSTNIGSLMQ